MTKPTARKDKQVPAGAVPYSFAPVGQEAPGPVYAWKLPAYEEPVAPATRHDLIVQVLADQDATVAEVTLRRTIKGKPMYSAGEVTSVTGSSKRNRGDSYDEEAGELLAVSRALRKLADKLERRGRGRMRHLDSIAKHKDEIRSGRKEKALARIREVTAQRTADLKEFVPGQADPAIDLKSELHRQVLEYYHRGENLLSDAMEGKEVEIEMGGDGSVTENSRVLAATRLILANGDLMVVFPDGRVKVWKADGRGYHEFSA